MRVVQGLALGVWLALAVVGGVRDVLAAGLLLG